MSENLGGGDFFDSHCTVGINLYAGNWVTENDSCIPTLQKMGLYDKMSFLPKKQQHDIDVKHLH